MIITELLHSDIFWHWKRNSDHTWQFKVKASDYFTDIFLFWLSPVWLMLPPDFLLNLHFYLLLSLFIFSIRGKTSCEITTESCWQKTLLLPTSQKLKGWLLTILSEWMGKLHTCVFLFRLEYFIHSYQSLDPNSGYSNSIKNYWPLCMF